MKHFILFVLIGLTAASASACVCEPALNQAYADIQKDIVDDNIDPLNKELDKWYNQLKENVQSLQDETEEYRTLVDHEKALYVMYKEMLFEVQKEVDLQANQNNVTAIDVQAILKQNEELAIIRAKKAEEH